MHLHKLAVLTEGKFNLCLSTTLWRRMNKYQPVKKQRLANRNASGNEMLH